MPSDDFNPHHEAARLRAQINAQVGASAPEGRVSALKRAVAEATANTASIAVLQAMVLQMDKEKAQLEECVRRLVNKVLHDPVRKLRQSDAAHAPAAQYLHALEMLFQLKDEEPPGEGDDKVTKAKPILSDR